VVVCVEARAGQSRTGLPAQTYSLIGASFLLRAVRCSVPLPICLRADPLEQRDFGRHFNQFFGHGKHDLCARTKRVLECLSLKFLYVQTKCYLGQVFLSPLRGLLSGSTVLRFFCDIDHGAVCIHVRVCAFPLEAHVLGFSGLASRILCISGVRVVERTCEEP
jgi:hypothetical protein